MILILKNTTISDILIPDRGITIQASPSSYTVPVEDALLFAASTDLLPYISSGDIVVNNGTSDLSVTAAENYLKFNFIPSGGADNTVLTKQSANDFDFNWETAPPSPNGLPTGGTANQSLIKIDGTNYNAQWGIPNTIETATTGYYKAQVDTAGIKFISNSVEVAKIDTAYGQIRIGGTTKVGSSFATINSNQIRALTLRGISNTSVSNNCLEFRRTKGTEANPTALADGDIIGGINCYGYDGTYFLESASSKFYVDGIVSTQNLPTAYELKLGNGITNVARLNMLADGNTGIYNASPTARLDIAGGIRIGNNGETGAGAIIYTGGEFQGHNGTSFIPLSNKVPTGGTVGQKLVKISGNDFDFVWTNGGYFGTYWTNAVSESESTTTSNTFQNKVTITTGIIPAGTYRVTWYYEYSQSVATADFKARVNVGGITVHNVNIEISDTTTYDSNSGFYNATLGAGATTITLDYSAESGTAKIRAARLEIYRMG